MSLIIFQCKSSTPLEPIKIGLLVAMTDANNPNFISDKDDRIDAAKLAVEEINNGGGIYGRTLELLIEDSENYNPVAVQKANKLINNGVVAIIGPNTSAGLKFIADSVTTKKGRVIISPSATSPVISNLQSDSNNTVWRTCPSDEYQVQIAVRYIKNELKKASVGIIFIDDVYGKNFAESLNKRLAIYKIKVNAVIPYPADAIDNLQYDFKEYIQKVLKGNPEILYIISASEAGKLISDLASYIESKKLTKPILMGCDGNFDPRVIKNTNLTFAEGMVGTAPGISSDDTNYKLFEDNFNKKYNKELQSIWAANIYDAVYLASYAMLRAGEKKILGAGNSELSKIISENLVDVAQNGTSLGVNDFMRGSELLRSGGQIDYQGASGDIVFDKNGDVTSGTYFIWKIENGKFVQLKTERYP
jgi:ABC-type branched-subunit amino acid transport system substrate-binding protein